MCDQCDFPHRNHWIPFHTTSCSAPRHKGLFCGDHPPLPRLRVSEACQMRSIWNSLDSAGRALEPLALWIEFSEAHSIWMSEEQQGLVSLFFRLCQVCRSEIGLPALPRSYVQQGQHVTPRPWHSIWTMFMKHKLLAAGGCSFCKIRSI